MKFLLVYLIADYSGKFYLEGWSIRQKGIKLPHLKKNTFYDSIHGPRAITYWVNHNRFPQVVQHDIPWDMVGEGMTRLPVHRRRWATKLFSENCGIGVTMEKWGFHIDSDCPMCGEEETGAHLLQCQSSPATDRWELSLQNLKLWMEKENTLPDIIEVILGYMNNWRTGETTYEYDGTWPGIDAAITHQSVIGWQCFIEGLISPQWSACQLMYYQWLLISKTGRRWAIMLISKLVSVAWDMWEHRNGQQHAPNNPRYVKAITALDRAIRAELIKGRGVLPRSQWHFFDTPLRDLIKKSLHYKTDWLTSIEKARTYTEGQRLGIASTEVCYHGERAALRKWMASGVGI